MAERPALTKDPKGHQCTESADEVARGQDAKQGSQPILVGAGHTTAPAHSKPASASTYSKQQTSQCQALTDLGRGHQCTKGPCTRNDLCIQHLKMGDRVVLASKGAPAYCLQLSCNCKALLCRLCGDAMIS